MSPPPAPLGGLQSQDVATGQLRIVRGQVLCSWLQAEFRHEQPLKIDQMMTLGDEEYVVVRRRRGRLRLECRRYQSSWLDRRLGDDGLRLEVTEGNVYHFNSHRLVAVTSSSGCNESNEAV